MKNKTIKTKIDAEVDIEVGTFLIDILFYWQYVNFEDFWNISNSYLDDWLEEYRNRIISFKNMLMQIINYFPDHPAFKCKYKKTWELTLKIDNNQLKPDDLKKDDFVFSEKNRYKIEHENEVYYNAIEDYYDNKKVEIIEETRDGLTLKKVISKETKDKKINKKIVNLTLNDKELDIIKQIFSVEYRNYFYGADFSKPDSEKDKAKIFLKVLEVFRKTSNDINEIYDDLRKQLYSPNKTKIISKNKEPDDSSSWISKGEAFEMDGDKQKALECYQKASELDPTDTMPFFNSAYLCDRDEKYEEAIEFYNKALEHNPSDDEIEHIYSNIANIFYRQLEFKKALFYNNKTIKIIQGYEECEYKRSELSSALSMKALILDGLGEYDKAIEYYKKALELSPHKQCTLFNFASLYQRLGEYLKSLELYKILISNYDDPSYMLEASILFLKTGDYRKGIDLIKNAIRLKPSEMALKIIIPRFKKLMDEDSKIKLMMSSDEQIKKIIGD